MRSVKFVGVELRSMPQFISILVSAPAILVYIVWSRLSSATIVTGSSVFPVPPNYNLQAQVLANLTSDTSIFVSFGLAQWKAFSNAVSAAVVFDFILGGLLGAFIFGVPIARGTVIHDIAALGSKGRVLAVRTLFLVLCATLLSSLTAVFLYYLPPGFGISPDVRFFFVLLGTSFLSILSSAFLTLLLTALSRDLVVPVLGVFTVFVGILAGGNFARLLLPFKDLTFILWSSSRFGHPVDYLYSGFVLYTVLSVLAVKAFEGGDFY
ncbi:hypothetical protein [Thermococcus sp.]